MSSAAITKISRRKQLYFLEIQAMAPSRNVISYPQPDAPKSSSSPLEALSPNPIYQPSIAAQYGYSALGAFAGGIFVLVNNMLHRRPKLSGVQWYPVSIAIGAASVYAFQKYKENQWAERDAIFRHYISLHPEDFPAYQRVKIADLFEDWTPVR